MNKMLDLEKSLKKRKMFVLSFSFITILLYIALSVMNVDFLTDSKMGKDIMFMLYTYSFSFFGITVIEVMTILLTDGIINLEEEVVKRAMNSSEGAGYILIAKAIKVLAYSIIVLAVILNYK